MGVRSGFGSWVVFAVVSLAAPRASSQSLSPGSLSEAHRSLDQAGKCGNCHKTGQEVGRELCLRCHEVTGRALAAGTGLHARLVRESGKGCGDCHAEHHGRRFSIVRFEAQLPDFEHGQTGYALLGKHQGLACARCHKGRLRYQGQSTRCASCHEDPHARQLGANCAACHSADGFKPPAGFDHGRAAFALTGRHQKVDCQKCHPVRAGTDRKWKGLAHKRCADCHEDPHRGAMRGACKSCHTTAGWKRVLNAAGPAHSPRGRFPLVGGHKRVGCARCHGKGMKRRVRGACDSCHREPHAGRFGADCQACHDVVNWKLRPGAAFDHEKTAYALAGRHRALDCQKCHPERGSYAARFQERAHGACKDCHRDPHGGPFRSVDRGDSCETCHRVEGFRPADYGLAEHARTAFPLDGGHVAVPCSRCHQSVKPRQPARLDLRPKDSACAACHADPHRGRFTKRAGPAGCAACHATTTWRDVRFDHRTTRFPLEGRHGQMSCQACHRGRASHLAMDYGGLDPRCEACHADPHAGQFASPPARACASCHGQTTFALPAFDHREATGWPIDGAHARAACPRCHAPVVLPSGGRAALFRLGSHDCRLCHRSPHRDLSPLACADCHQSVSWQALPEKVAFDHQRVGFVLTFAHAQASCQACHPGRAETAGPRPRSCADCHPDRRHHGRLGDRCESCHDARGWRVAPQVRDHQRTRFPLVGAHRVADCFACHPSTEPDAYRGTPRDCVACHQADYARAGNHPDHVAGGFSTRCEECHTQYAWPEARVRHQFWPLRGAHALADCFACHGGGRWGDAPTACVACHQADYDGAQDPDHQGLGFPTRCEDCHRDLAWVPARSDWHAAFFPLREGHGRLACQDCHPAGPGVGFTCTDCHEHEQARMDDKHRDRGGYVYESQACLGCHPRG